jgi:prepilin-type N-terminal cleavage/methylation domain-containing protein
MTHRGEDGFTLLELVIAMVLLSIGIAALIGVLATSFRSTAVDIHRTDATAIAGQGLAELEGAPVSGPLPPVTRNGQTYNLAGKVTPATASNGAPDAYLTAAVTVRWTDASGAHSLTQSTSFFTPPPTTSAPSACTPLGPVVAVAGEWPGEPSLDVSWQEPTGGPVAFWQVQISPNGGTWTTPVSDEQPLAAGATHQVHIGGLEQDQKYKVQVVATTVCGATQSFSDTSPRTPSVASSACSVGSMTFGPADAQRVTSGPSAGTLTSDITVVVTTPGTCDPLGMQVYVDTGHGSYLLPLSPTGAYSYVGTLPGVTQMWDLGVHQVYVYAGVTPAGSGVLCVEEQGSATC